MEEVEVTVTNADGTVLFSAKLVEFNLHENREIRRVHNPDGTTKELIPAKVVSVTLTGLRRAE